MAIKKISQISPSLLPDLIPMERITGNDAVTARFRTIADQVREEQIKTAKSAKKGEEGKQLSPRVDDFLYAHCIMMHAAEASLVNHETGEALIGKSGKPVNGGFSKFKDSKGDDSIKWSSSDGILPYRNGNGDIFPEEDLIKAHKDWIGKPLCKDHVSSTVDGIRGIVIDTYYDEKYKRVHALFALDRKNYAELARKVEAGYATSVSMGTAVGRSICSDCGNVATVESEYCPCVKNRTCHGEVNCDLSPIELSIVVTGADPKAKIMTVLAHLASYQKIVSDVKSGKSDVGMLKSIANDLDMAANELKMPGTTKTEEQAVKEILSELEIFRDRNVSPENKELGEKFLRKTLREANKTLENLSPENKKMVLEAAQSAGIDLEEKNDLLSKRLQSLLNNESDSKDTGTDIQPGLVSKEGPVKNELVDSNGYGLAEPGLNSGSVGQNSALAISSLYIDRAKNSKSTLDIANLANKIADLKNQIADIEIQVNEERIMSFADLKKKRMERKAYWQGTEEPTPGKPKYPSMGDQDKLREKEDRHMLQDGKMGGTDGAVPGDEQAKKLVQRAELEERRARRASWLKEAAGKVTVVQTKEGPKAVDEQGQMMASDGKTAAKKKKDDDEEEDDKEDKKSKKDDKKDDDKDSKDDKSDKKSKKDDKEDKEESKAGKKGVNPFAKDDDKKDSKDKKKKEAFYQGTEEPTPGKPKYPSMGDQDKLREKEDRQMQQTGNMGGDDGMVPGDEQVKKELQRMAGKIGAKLFKGASIADSRWEFTNGGKTVLTITAGQAYGDSLSKKFTGTTTYADLFHSEAYGSRVMSMLRENGLTVTASKFGLTKTAADALPPPPPAPEGDVPAPEAPAGDKGAEDKLKDLSPLITKLEEVLAEIQEVVGTKSTPEEEGLGEVDVASGGNAPAMPAPGADVTASVSDKDMLEAFAFVNDTCNELCYIESQSAEKGADAGFAPVVEQALTDAQAAYAQAKSLVASYASQKKNSFLAKRAAARLAFVAKANAPEMLVLDDKELGQAKEEAQEVLSDHENKLHEESVGGEELLADLEDDCGDTMMAADATAIEHAAPVAPEMMAMDYQSMDATARKAWREGLVKSAGEYLDIYEKERKGGGHKLENLDVKVSDDGDKVETLTEIHDKMMDVATKPMAKVKSAAEKLDKWIRSDAISANKLDALVAVGAVDSEVAKYWKQYFGQADGGKEFATGLVTEFAGKKKASLSQDTEALEVRIRRAYDLGLEAQKKGIVGQTTADLNKYVDTMKKLADEQFNAMKSHVELYRAPQGLVSAPLVGINEKEAGLDSGMAKTASVNAAPTFENLSKIWG